VNSLRYYSIRASEIAFLGDEMSEEPENVSEENSAGDNPNVGRPQTPQELGKQAYDQAREATGHAVEAVKILFSDPMGGQEKAIGLLGQAKAMSAGVVFIAAFVAVNLLFTIGPVNSVATSVLMLQGKMQATIEENNLTGMREMTVKRDEFASSRWFAFASGSCFAAGVVLAIYLIGKFLGSGANVPISIFTGGVAIAPLALSTIVTWICLKLKFLTLMGGVGFFCFAISILLVNTSLVSIQKISTRAAVLLTPGTFVAAGFVMYVGIKILG